jgi:PAS domain S-box-containing protein
VSQPETQLEEFFDLSIDPLSIIGFDGEFKRVNASFVRLLGYTEPELFTRSVLDILHPDDVEAAREALAHLAEGHDLVGFEARVSCADGSVRWLEWNTRSMPERGVLYSVARDTTDRRGVEAELREARRSLEASRDELRMLAEQQAALRRVATLVARVSPQGAVFDAIAEEMTQLARAEQTIMLRFEDGQRAVAVATTWTVPGVVSVGSRYSLGGEGPASQVLRTRRAVRIDDFGATDGPLAEVARASGIRSVVATPIVVEDRLWGALATGTANAGPLPPETEPRLAEFTDLMATAIANTEAKGTAVRLVDEQAALRRVATLVAKEAEPAEIFAKVAEEAGLVLGVDCTLWRNGGDGTASVVAVGGAGVSAGFPLGTRIALEGDGVAQTVLRGGKPHRVDDYSSASTVASEGARERGISSAVGYPITLGGRTWGAMVVAAFGGEEPFPPDTERRLAQFVELVGTTIANAEARAEVARLGEEQAALQRVATLVAEDVPPDELFEAVAREVGSLFDADFSGMIRFEDESTVDTVAAWAAVGEHPPVPERWRVEPGDPAALILEARQPVRVEDWAGVPGPIAVVIREQLGANCSVGCPIVVEGRLWGALAIHCKGREPLPRDTEARIEQFADLVATAIANAEARGEVERLADEQSALRRVATAVARGVEPAELFSTVTQEVARLFLEAEPSVVPSIIRFDPGPEFVLVGTAKPQYKLPLGSRWGPKDLYVSTRVFRTGLSAQVEASDVAALGGPDAELLRAQGFHYQVGSPILVENRAWGAMTINSTNALAPDTGERLEKFTELVATAIANSESREGLNQLAHEQSALRRVAEVVAREAPEAEVFAAIAKEGAQLFGTENIGMVRFEADGTQLVLASSGRFASVFPTGSRGPPAGHDATTRVFETGQPVRLEDYTAVTGPIAEAARSIGIRSVVAAPIVVEGQLWGAMVTGTADEEALPPETPSRLGQFTQLVATAIANADGRDQLTASRARLVTESDEARRRVVRDLHDGAQQRLVHSIITLKLAQRALREGDGEAEPLIAEALEQAEQSNAELRELAHGILPSVLMRGGLQAGVETVVSRVDLPVAVDVPAGRFPTDIEASAYFIVAEALTNVVKHARAGSAEVSASVQDGMLRVEVRDDGVGGADADGHGLMGLSDRVTALGGTLKVESPAGSGTVVTARLPVSAG